MTTAKKPVEWDDGPPEQWWMDTVDAAIAATPYEGLPWTVTTECPRCHHAMSETLKRIYGLKPVADWDPSNFPQFEFACDCDQDHEQPEGKKGCGWKADFKTPWNR